MVITTTCFKGTMSDLLLINKNNSFKNSETFETGIRDHHLLVYSMLKTPCQKREPKRQLYRDNISLSEYPVLIDLSNSIENSHSYGAFKTKTVKILDKKNC